MCPVRSLEVLGASLACLAIGCDTPNTNIVLGNRYPLVAANALVAYRGFWQNVAFENTSFTTASRTSTALAIMSVPSLPRRGACQKAEIWIAAAAIDENKRQQAMIGFHRFAVCSRILTFTSSRVIIRMANVRHAAWRLVIPRSRSSFILRSHCSVEWIRNASAAPA